MSLHENIVRIAKKYSKKTAVIDSATEKTYSFGKFLTASFIFADIIKKKEDEFIGIMLPMSAAAFISFLATLITGKVPVMLNYSTDADANVAHARKKIGFKTVITSKKLCDKIGFNSVSDMIYAEDIASDISMFQKIKAAFKSILPGFFISEKKPDDIAVILFTTGSERDPKAVMLSHDNIKSNVDSLSDLFIFDSEDIFTGVLPLFHVYGLTTSFFMPLLSGAAVNTYANPLDYKFVSQGIMKNRTSIITATPTFLRGYCQRSESGDFKSLRVVMAGGDKLTKSLRDMFFNKHGIEILEGYGTTETSPVISVNTVENKKPGSIGMPIPGASVKIIDIDTEQPLPAGQEGKIYVKGRMVMKGYFGDMELTALHIRNGWYDTGDIGMLDEDGFLWHRGRLKRFVKIGGEMVSLTAVENAVEKIIGDEEQCCAAEIPHVTRGSDIIIATTSEQPEKVLKKKLIDMLPPISVPKKIIHFKELPLMGNGKVDFRSVGEMCRSGNSE